VHVPSSLERGLGEALIPHLTVNDFICVVM